MNLLGVMWQVYRIHGKAGNAGLDRADVEGQGQELQEKLVARVGWSGYPLNWDTQTPFLSLPVFPLPRPPPFLRTGIMGREYSVSLNGNSLDQGRWWGPGYYLRELYPVEKRLLT